MLSFCICLGQLNKSKISVPLFVKQQHIVFVKGIAIKNAKGIGRGVAVRIG